MTTQLTVTLPDELASRLRPLEDKLPQILELGLLHWNALPEGVFGGLVDVLETLAELPSPEEVLSLRPSPELKERINHLLEKNQREGFLPNEEREWQQYEYVEHLVRLAKAKAAIKLKATGGSNEPNVHSN